MSSSTQVFTSPRSIEVLDQLEKLLEQAAPAAVRDLAVPLRLSAGQVALYMRELERTGRAHCCRAAFHYALGSSPRMWAAGKSDAAVSSVTRHDLERRVVVRKTWAPHHVRDALDCALFGAPAAMAVAA